MNNKILRLFMIAFVAINFVSCDDEETITPPSTSGPTTYNSGNVSLEFLNSAGGTVALDASGATNYVNAAGETFNVELFKYYVSNVKLIKDDGSKYAVPNSYFLIDANDTNSLKVNMADIPGGKYTGIEYLIGVDSTRNVSGSQTGALDPVNGMFWSWSTGYIFMKLEGQSSSSSNNSYTYHIGGYKWPHSGLRTTSIDFTPSVLVVDGGKREAEIHIITDVLEIFKNPSNISIANGSFIMTPSPSSSNMADNYVDMFKFDHIHNDPL
jgi:hypothetical protein